VINIIDTVLLIAEELRFSSFLAVFWIRIRIGSGSGLDPDFNGNGVPDPDSQSGSGSRRAKMTKKGNL
jgi:hypothetical protein